MALSGASPRKTAKAENPPAENAGGPDLGHSLRLAGIGLLLLPATLALIPVQMAFVRFHRPMARRLPKWWHRMTLRMIGVRLVVRGAPAAGSPLMIVANHVSWSDILVLGAAAELSFIAKAEVAGWPGVGLLARLQRTVFVDRQKKRDSARQAGAIASRLAQGDTMVLFPEGTTGDGHRIGPFKTWLFGAINTALQETGLEQAVVQPVTIAYTRLHGMPLCRYHRAKAAWPGDLELAPHLSGFLRHGAYDVEVVFGEPVSYRADSDRKRMAHQVRESVRETYSASMRMRAQPKADGGGPA